MAWSLSGHLLEACSCKMLCPCIFGPAEPDQGWCSGALTFDIQEGNADGVNLSGRRVVWAFDLPGDFFGGNATARLYIDDDASDEQRRDLEAIFTGKKGGAMEAVGASVTKWLPTKTASIKIQRGDKPSVSVGNFGQVTLAPIKTESGKAAQITNAPLNEAFGISSEDLARSDGSRWSDPDMRRWEAGGAGGVSAFSLSA